MSVAVAGRWLTPQADFHLAKQQYHTNAKVPREYGYSQTELDRGFLASRLWGYSRHPNFAAEQAIWIMFNQWSCYTTRVLYSWFGVGALCLLFLFQGSTWMTELVSSGKYPEY